MKFQYRIYLDHAFVRLRIWRATSSVDLLDAEQALRASPYCNPGLTLLLDFCSPQVELNADAIAQYLARRNEMLPFRAVALCALEGAPASAAKMISEWSATFFGEHLPVFADAQAAADWLGVDGALLRAVEPPPAAPPLV